LPVLWIKEEVAPYGGGGFFAPVDSHSSYWTINYLRFNLTAWKSTVQSTHGNSAISLNSYKKV
jgi:hypothetical protein